MSTPRSFQFEYGKDADAVAAVLRNPEFLRWRAEANGDRRFRSGGVVIQRVGSIAVRTPADLQGAVEAARRAGQDSLLLMVWSPGSGSGAVVVELPDPE